ncbi:MAG: PBECR2 nuclease fold domain-containing protein [Ruminococcus sp.]
MHIIGKINKNIYKCVTEDITTEEVIITDNQINHIKTGIPTITKNFSSYFSDILSDPDFILEANKPNTAFILKQITENDFNGSINTSFTNFSRSQRVQKFYYNVFKN